MTVVSDASPLHYLVLIEAENVLAQLFSEVVVPPAVLRELSHERAPERVRRWASDPPEWLRVMGPANVSLDAKLGDGEAEAIGLALEIRAKTLLIDERDGTNIARRLGVATVGTLGVLMLASVKNLLPLDQLLPRSSKPLSEFAHRFWPLSSPTSNMVGPKAHSVARSSRSLGDTLRMVVTSWRCMTQSTMSPCIP